MGETSEPELKSDSWSMSDERAFMENLLCSRFNFFLVFFALVIAAAVSTSHVLHFKIVLTLGAALSIPFALTIARAQAKLNIALDDHLLKTEGHPAKILNDKCCGPSVRRWIGYWIPMACCVTLVVGAILAWTGCLTTGSCT
ncbi:MAG: hypothetical protein JW743_09530 [Deltaproteobacteria bacterium]|nr:hypothetical protein [Deltaproteobacteria bacterium]MBN2844750.1 hypothetical protein [Deltaproteobacteria bacterium]